MLLGQAVLVLILVSTFFVVEVQASSDQIHLPSLVNALDDGEGISDNSNIRRFAQNTSGAVSIRGAAGGGDAAPISIKRSVSQRCGEDAELIPIASAEIEIVGQLSEKAKSQFFPFEVTDVSTISVELSDNPSYMYFGITNIYGEEIVEEYTGKRGVFNQLLAPGRYCVFAKMYQRATIFRLKAGIVPN